MKNLKWTPDMNAHLLRLLTEIRDTPESFRDDWRKTGNVSAAVAQYFNTMHDSFKEKLDIDLSLYLGKLDPV